MNEIITLITGICLQALQILGLVFVMDMAPRHTEGPSSLPPKIFIILVYTLQPILLLPAGIYAAAGLTTVLQERKFKGDKN
jgi:hypothetical protein